MDLVRSGCPYRREVPHAGPRSGGFVITAVLGIVGALVGGFVGRPLRWYGDGNPVAFVMAVIGAIIVLAVYRFTIGRTATV
jgi:uncharacterized membrane protein YeaQ/YmgE (transglycosylase-associated protein family)